MKLAFGKTSLMNWGVTKTLFVNHNKKQNDEKESEIS